MWDAEWSFGITCWDDVKQRFLTELKIDDIIWPTRKYFGRLFLYKPFVDAVKEEWENYYRQPDVFEHAIGEIAEELQDAQIYNFERWDVLGKNISVGLLHFDTWEEEVKYVVDYYTYKKEILNDYINSL